VRVVVIGAGIVGSCLAYRLAERGAEVVLVDAGHPAGGLSAHSFAWLNAVASAGPQYFALTLEGLAAHRRLAADLGEPGWLVPTGNLQWASAPSDRDAMLDRADLLRQSGYPVREYVPERACAELEPDVRLERACGPVLYYSADAYLRPTPLIVGLLARAGSLGLVARFGTTVADILVCGSRVDGVVSGAGERLAADVVVCCAGRGTADLVGRVGARVPLLDPADPGSATVGLLVRTTPVPVRLRRVLHAPGLSVRPDEAGRLLLHCHDVDRLVRAGGTGPVAPAAAAAAAEFVLDRLGPVVRGAAGARVEQAYVGVRPMPADGLSVVGWVPGVESLYVVVTHSGMTLAPVLAEVASREVTGVPQDVPLAFRPDRFLPAASAT